MKKISTDPVEKPVNNHRASAPEPINTPLHGLLTNCEPKTEPATPAEAVGLVGCVPLIFAVLGLVGWVIWS